MNTAVAYKEDIYKDKELMFYAKRYPKSYKLYVNIMQMNLSSPHKIYMLKVLYNELINQFVETGENFCDMTTLKLCRSKSYLGRCRRNDLYEECTIYISDHLFACGFIPIVNVMAHEIIHSIKNFPRGHKADFVAMMNRLNYLFGLHIQKKGAYRCENHTEIHKEEKKPKFVLTCKCCGHKYYYYKESKAIKNYKRYHCHKCKGRLEIKEL